jgi:DNA-binding response OmpR family regulator
MRILVVDDDKDTREVLDVVLGCEGHEVLPAADGADALRQLGVGELPSLILLDLMMLRMDGETLVRELKRTRSWAQIPFVVVAGTHAACRRAEELGAAACLVKPIELEELIAVVNAVAERSPASSPPGYSG